MLKSSQSFSFIKVRFKAVIIKFKTKMNESRPKLNRYKIEAVTIKKSNIRELKKSAIISNIQAKINGRTN
jgi:hypothetical protein